MHNAPIFYIQVTGEGGTHPALPDTRPESAPMLVNQNASAATLIDAAHARVERIGLIAKPFTFIGGGLSHIPPGIRSWCPSSHLRSDTGNHALAASSSIRQTGGQP